MQTETDICILCVYMRMFVKNLVLKFYKASGKNLSIDYNLHFKAIYVNHFDLVIYFFALIRKKKKAKTDNLLRAIEYM